MIRLRSISGFVLYNISYLFIYFLFFNVKMYYAKYYGKWQVGQVGNLEARGVCQSVLHSFGMDL